MSIDTLTCPTGCETELLIVEFSECSPTLLGAQISDIYIGNDGNPLTNWSDPAELAARIDNDSTDATAIRHLTVIGDKPKSEKSQQKISHNRITYSKKTFTINFRIDDNTEANYEFGRSTECNGTYRIWFATLGGKLYGGNEGIKANVEMEEVIVEDDTQYATINGTIKWTSKFSPIRIDNPIAADEA